MTKPKTALILPTRNEGKLLSITVAAHLLHVDHLYIIEDRCTDGCVDAVAREYTAEPRVEVVPLPRETTGVGRLPVGGPGRGRRYGTLLAAAQGYDVAIVADAHTRPRIGTLADLARQAYETGGMWMAGVSPWRDAACQPDQGEWCRAGKHLKLAGGRLSYFENAVCDLGAPDKLCDLPPSAAVTHVYGSVYAARVEVWQALQGYPPTISWGYNEQALSLACMTLGIPMFASRRCVCWHWFKKALGIPAGDGVSTGSKTNRYIAHYVCCDDAEWAQEFKALKAELPIQAKTFAAVLPNRPEIEATRQAYLAARVRKWADVKANIGRLILPSASPTPAPGADNHPVILESSPPTAALAEVAPPTRKEVGNAPPIRKSAAHTHERPWAVSIIVPGREDVCRLFRMAVIAARPELAGVLYVSSGANQLPTAATEADIVPGAPPLVDPYSKTSMERAENQAANWRIALEWLKANEITAPVLSWEPDVIIEPQGIATLLAQAGERVLSTPIMSRHRLRHLMLYRDRKYHCIQNTDEPCVSCHLGLTYLPYRIWSAWEVKAESDAKHAAVDHALCDQFREPIDVCWEVCPRHHITGNEYVRYPNKNTQLLRVEQ